MDGLHTARYAWRNTKRLTRPAMSASRAAMVCCAQKHASFVVSSHADISFWFTFCSNPSYPRRFQASCYLHLKITAGAVAVGNRSRLYMSADRNFWSLSTRSLPTSTFERCTFEAKRGSTTNCFVTRVWVHHPQVLVSSATRTVPPTVTSRSTGAHTAP